MSTTGMPGTDPLMTRALVDRCRLYRSEFGFQTSIDPRSMVITMRSRQHSGVLVPAALGYRAWSQMSFPVPVIAVKKRALLFVTDGFRPEDHSAALELAIFTHRIVPLWPGRQIMLPTPGIASRVWLRLPAGEGLPVLQSIIDVLVDVRPVTRAPSVPAC
ncbi:hypothetical protein [Nocardia aurantia]|uniref:Uncharacterized protein n=1 Tax=Nocardia aurantia TaxID=2585199 RepID=A0A7K0DSZ8_9NOCA|nr:hypothetical protein [Nocardia aurantia]MQY28900.1 hypothetical protein [Nocardia aurantia]